jgi:hypothetical protein
MRRDQTLLQSVLVLLCGVVCLFITNVPFEGVLRVPGIAAAATIRRQRPRNCLCGSPSNHRAPTLILEEGSSLAMKLDELSGFSLSQSAQARQRRVQTKYFGDALQRARTVTDGIGKPLRPAGNGLLCGELLCAAVSPSAFEVR